MLISEEAIQRTGRQAVDRDKMMSYKYSVIISVVIMAARNVDAQITFDTSNIANGEYAYKFYGDLYDKEESGKLDSEGNLIVTGEYRYVLGDKEYVVTYLADKDGYHPKLTVSDNLRPPLPAVGVAFGLPAGAVATLLG